MTRTDSRSDCEAIVRRLWPYLDDRLPASERAWIAGHLAACRECAAHFDFARAFLSALQGSPSDAADTESLRRRVLAALAEEGFSP